MKLLLAISIMISCLTNSYSQSPYFPWIKGDSGIQADSILIIDWATGYDVHRGYIRIDDKLLGHASSGEDNFCIGKADNRVVSIGDSGYVVLTFDVLVKNTSGPDIAIFENSFDGFFLELAFVEVSSDSSRWVRFPSVSDTPSNVQVNSFETLDPDKIHNLAGKNLAGYGTPFDLEELKDSAGIDIMAINYIRITDVIGSINPEYASFDSRGEIINDPWPTPFGSSGFDLDAVAILGDITYSEKIIDDILRIYPNPVADHLYLETTAREKVIVRIHYNDGQLVKQFLLESPGTGISVSHLVPGVYIITAETTAGIERKLFIKGY